MNEKCNILLVDDELDTLQTYALLLSKEQYNIHKFLSAVEALSFLRFTDKKIELVIADLNMPGMDGIKFIQQVRKISSCQATPFVFFSGLNKRDLILEAYKNGAADFIPKPVDNDIFISKINALVHSFRMYALHQNILLNGSNKMFTIEEVVEYCEQEQVDGFAYLDNVKEKGLIEFEKGILKHIKCENLEDAHAFEKMKTWTDYRFIIARGKFNLACLEFFNI